MLTRALTVALAAPAAVLGVEACSGELVTTTADGGELDASTDVGSSDAESCAPVVLEVIDGSTDSGCPYTSEIEREPCGAPSNVTVYSDCYFRLDDCSRVCPGNLYFACHYVSPNCDGGIVDDGSTGNSTDTLVECLTSPAVCGTGRKPDGLLPTHHRGRVSHVGAWLAAAAHLEAASVHAFRILERELAELGAPDDLLLAAERARKDEIRHTKTAARLAKAHGGAPARARVRKARARSLEEIAIENVVEGCVRETFGALVAKHQAARAKDAAIAAAMTEIAEDETRHAALAWSVAAWAESKLDAAANARVHAAKERALRDLEREIANEPHRELVSIAGLPSARTQKAMLAALFDVRAAA